MCIRDSWVRKAWGRLLAQSALDALTSQ